MPASPPAGHVDLVIDVVYDGPDLDDVARHTGLNAADVVDAHTATPWQVAFGGFAPGFAYLVGGDPRLTVPRRPGPRQSVPAGSVGLAGEFSGIYPRKSPGGWQLIGRTEAVMWDIDRPEPALLTPGMLGPIPGRRLISKEIQRAEIRDTAHRTAGAHSGPRPGGIRAPGRRPFRSR